MKNKFTFDQGHYFQQTQNPNVSAETEPFSNFAQATIRTGKIGHFPRQQVYIENWDFQCPEGPLGLLCFKLDEELEEFFTDFA